MEWQSADQDQTGKPPPSLPGSVVTHHATPAPRPGLRAVHINPEVEEHIRRLDNPEQRDESTVALNRLMLDERNYARVAADPALFAKLYHRVKQPDRAKVAQFSPDIAAKQQEIHSTYDQLHHILARTGTARGLANQPQYAQQIGTEERSVMTAETARAVQFDAIAKLIALHGGKEVRMPVYTHRFGPMQQKSADPARTAAGNMNAILGSADPGGANIRVTPADRGRGAYISTDSDNFYGPHGVTLDPRDVHQLPLSTESLDNRWEVSSERTKEERHQFRAMGKPIPLTKDGGPAYASIFATSSPERGRRLQQTLQPGQFTPGVLQDSMHDTLKAVLDKVSRGTAQSRPQPRPAVATPGLREQPVSNEQAFMTQSLVQELNGLYEPHAWTTQWRDNPDARLMKGMSDALDKMKLRKPPEPPSDTSKDDEWN
ncbi:hypothetical protein [Solirubrobacter soli]|uniref:hypothetical protein n=1 Tax=Solirubrobacter soli TaxID=363832 RepID=UPI00040A01DC|nr:hypothetical protein [Solirubrobacter soli]